MRSLTAKDIMTTSVLVATAEMTVQELAELLTENMISGAPVVDQSERLVGVVSLGDIARSERRRAMIIWDRLDSDFYLRGWEDEANPEELNGLHVEAAGDLLVQDIMTPLLYQVPESMPLPDLVDTMIEGRIHRLIVVREGRVQGIISTLDLLKAIRRHLGDTVDIAKK